MVVFIDAHRDVYGVEPICAQLPIAPSQYYEATARETAPNDDRHPCVAMKHCSRKFGASTRRTSTSMARARCGGNCVARRSKSRAAR